MPLTFRRTGIVLIFWQGSFIASQSLSTRVTSQPVSRHTEPLGSVGDGKAAELKVIEVVTKFQPLKARPDPGADNFAADLRTSLAKEELGHVSAMAS